MRYLLVLLAFFPAVAAAQRAELPVREVDLSDGTRRYAVTLTIDGRTVQAGLDTGSTGLRVLPRALGADAQTAKGEHVHYSYGAGTAFDGPAIKIVVGGGAVSGAVKVQRIDRIGCTSAQPKCPAARVDMAHFGIQGDGRPGEGFDAILGIRLKSDVVENPFAQLGVKQWIVELPRPGEASGRIVLNPTPDEIAGYSMIGVDDDGTTAGCLVGPAALGRICGRTFFDTGAPGLRVIGGPNRQNWPDGTPVQIAIGDGKAIDAMAVVIGRRDQASGMFYSPAANIAAARLSLGLAPYFHWAVLYDAGRHSIGVKAR